MSKLVLTSNTDWTDSDGLLNNQLPKAQHMSSPCWMIVLTTDLLFPWLEQVKS